MIAHRNDGIAGPVVPAQALGQGADHAARIVDPATSEISAATAQEDGDLTAVPSAADALQLGNESRGAGKALRAAGMAYARVPSLRRWLDRRLARPRRGDGGGEKVAREMFHPRGKEVIQTWA